MRGALGGRCVGIPEYDSTEIYDFVRETISHEHGRATLTGERHPTADVLDAILHEQDVLVWLDVVELSFRSVERFCGFDQHRRRMQVIV